MLTITAPIKTVLNPDLCESNESFGRRIMANYDQMSEFITREDLFHLVTQPPEIFMLGEGGSSFLSETEIHNTQLKKVEIVNNLMNRILVSADGNLTYQDEVYITNVLHKLGISDEKTFMKKVYNLFDETKENNNLIETYWQNRQELSQMISFYRMQTKEGDHTEITNESEEILHLHEDVFKRWMTAAVYRMQNNFRSTGDSNTVINADSYRMTEEQRLSQQILLQRLRESVRGESVPLVYRHENYYESPMEGEKALEPEAVAEQIASAVLLSLADNLYENITNKSVSVGDKFYRTENAFYGAAEHVFERMEGNTAYIISEHRAGDVTIQQTQQLINEQNAIAEILNHYYDGSNMTTQQFFETDVMESADMVYPEIAPAEEAEKPVTEITVDQRNSLEQQVYQMNIRNEQRRREYIKNLENMSRHMAEGSDLGMTDEDKKASMQFAFEHPEEFKQMAREEAAREEEVSDEAARQFIEALPAKTQEIYRTIEQYIKSPEIFAGTHTVQSNAEFLLVREQIEAEREERLIRETSKLSETIEKSTESERRITDRVGTVEETVGRITPETVRLVHKVNDVTIDEETINSIRREINEVRNETKKMETKVDNTETVTREQINNVNTTIINEQNEDQITRMIQDNINRQIGTITGKVYNRLERQLMSERRRRGM